MIKEGKTIRVIDGFGISHETYLAMEYMLSRTVINYDATIQFMKVDKKNLMLGKTMHYSMYDMNKIDIPIYKRLYGGSGTVAGTNDVIMSIHVNKETFVTDLDTTANQGFDFFNGITLNVIRSYGIDAQIQKEADRKNRTSGVCLMLSGRSEIISNDGNKLVGNIFKEDELTFNMGTQVMVDSQWADIFDYLKAPVHNQHVGSCINTELGYEIDQRDFCERYIKELSKHFNIFRDEYTEQEVRLSKKVDMRV